MSDVHEVLVKARNLVDSGWGQGPGIPPAGTVCAGLAIRGSTADVLVAACDVFEKVNGIDRTVMRNGIVDWNDAPGRTKAEVLAAFDVAINATAPAPAWDSLPTPQSEVEASDTVEVGA